MKCRCESHIPDFPVEGSSIGLIHASGTPLFVMSTGSRVLFTVWQISEIFVFASKMPIVFMLFNILVDWSVVKASAGAFSVMPID